jgi:hypothetical protein
LAANYIQWVILLFIVDIIVNMYWFVELRTIQISAPSVVSLGWDPVLCDSSFIDFPTFISAQKRQINRHYFSSSSFIRIPNVFGL